LCDELILVRIDLGELVVSMHRDKDMLRD
jgi:hypothetical protein